MIKTLNPCSNNPAKAAEIMSRYRPIAPKPESPASEGSSSSLSPKIKQSPYLRNLWPQLQARPTRTRKRGRALPSFKRHRTHLLGFCPPTCHVTPPPTTTNLSLHTSFSPALPQVHPLPNPNHGHGVLNCALKNTPTTTPPSLVTLPLLPCSPSPKPAGSSREEVVEYLNTATAEIPEEKDLLKQLQGPNASNVVIAPQPVRPIGSCINVGYINEDPTLPRIAHAPKRPEQVEEEVECEPLPAIISDSNNTVRMANSAYREMVGQPQCSWLESMVNCGDGRLPRGACTRISGEVALHLCDSRVPISSSNGFSCWVRIEWNNADGNKKSSVNAFCDVIRLSCKSRDYLFTWRFHTRTGEAPQPS